jgi:hypothetical protein
LHTIPRQSATTARAGTAAWTDCFPPTLTEQGLEALLFAPLDGSKPGKRLKTEQD